MKKAAAWFGLSSGLLLALWLLLPEPAPAAAAAPLAAEDLVRAARVAGLAFDDPELEQMVAGVADNVNGFARLRAVHVPADLPPAVRFDPRVPGIETAARRAERVVGAVQPQPDAIVLPDVRRPGDLDDLAFADLRTLASLVRSRQVSCIELTQLFLARLERLHRTLNCVVTLLPERALAQAELLDRELARGVWRGPLHGIPWGAKDIIAVAGAPTTWGAEPFRDQAFHEDAIVVRRLDAAGAVLVAKLSLGELALGDHWFGGITKNPWDPRRGASGSSAGSAAATAAGGVVFALGSETYGSIVSPAARCGISALRPTFGRVPRHGAMALAWTLDKLGPMCRSLDDAAIVFEALLEPCAAEADVRDDGSTIPHPFRRLDEVDVAGWRVGYLAGAFDDELRRRSVLEPLRDLGVELVPVTLPDAPVEDLMLILSVEAAASFDEMTRDGRDDLLARQDDGAWPNLLRVARLVPAVEYLRAQRIRTQICRDADATLRGLAALVHAPFARTGADGEQSVLGLANLAGLPSVVAPCGFDEHGMPVGVSFTGALFSEDALLALASAWQRHTTFHRARPQVR